MKVINVNILEAIAGGQSDEAKCDCVDTPSLGAQAVAMPEMNETSMQMVQKEEDIIQSSLQA